jgi:L-amino acid N-acyltransferase YncA
MTKDDWPAVGEIYKQGIETGNATFQQSVPGWEEWDKNHIKFCRIIAESAGQIAGWAALTQVSERYVYSGVAEVSIYISQHHRGMGIGKILLEKLVEESEANGFWTLQAGIFPENIPSIELHKKAGFRVVGYREKIGKMNDIWRDTILLERRSRKIH